MNIRVRIGKKQVAQSQKLDGTIIYETANKAQLLFPNLWKLNVGDEITIQNGNVIWNGMYSSILFNFYKLYLDGVVTITVYGEDSIIRHTDHLITKAELSELSYPEKE